MICINNVDILKFILSNDSVMNQLMLILEENTEKLLSIIKQRKKTNNLEALEDNINNFEFMNDLMNGIELLLQICNDSKQIHMHLKMNLIHTVTKNNLFKTVASLMVLPSLPMLQLSSNEQDYLQNSGFGVNKIDLIKQNSSQIVVTCLQLVPSKYFIFIISGTEIFSIK